MITVSNNPQGAYFIFRGLGKCLRRAEKKEAVKYGQGIANSF